GLLLFIGGLFTSQAESVMLSGGKHNGFPVIKNYSSEEYDRHIQNLAVTSDSDGIVFIANMTGVLRFDGVNWSFIELPNLSALSISSDDKGIVFVGGNGEFGHLVKRATENPYVKEIVFESLSEGLQDTLNIGMIWNTLSHDGVVYFQDRNHVFRYEEGKLTTIQATSHFINIFKAQDAVYVREHGIGVREVTENGLVDWEYGSLFRERSIQAYLQTTSGDVVCSFLECFHFDRGQMTEFTSEAADYLRKYNIHEALLLSDGTIAIATRNGGVVHLQKDGRLAGIYTKDHGLASNTVFGLYEDVEAGLWVATINGISRLELQLPLRRYDQRFGIHEVILGMTRFKDSYYFTAPGGIYQMSENGTLLLHDNIRTCRQIYVVEEQLYALCSDRLVQYHEGRFRNLSGSEFAHNVVFDSATRGVAIHETGITVFEINESAIEKHYQIMDASVRSRSAIAHEDIYWIGTSEDGVYRLQLEMEENEITGHLLKNYVTHQDNDTGRNNAFVVQLRGEPAILTWEKGILRYDEQADSLYKDTESWNRFSDPGHQYFRAVEDDIGGIWMQTQEGIMADIPCCPELERVTNAVLSRIRDRQLNSMYCDPAGYIWFMTDQGLIRMETDHHYEYQETFFTSVANINSRRDTLLVSYPGDEPYVFPYENNELRFTFFAATYNDPEMSEFRVRLEGFDSEWSDWSGETWKDYTNIPEGSYRFLVQARNVYGVISSSRPVLLVIQPPWYRTWWAYITYFLLFSGILYLAHWIRLQQLLRIERIRNKIAGDLHDEVSATLSSISFFAQAIGPQKLEGGRERFIELIKESAGDAKEKISDIVWAINPEHDDWRSFLSRCKRYASDLLESSNMKYTLRIDEEIPGKLDMQLRQHLWLVYKEMLTNTVRHSNATHVHVVLQYSGGRLTLAVQDNGSGFEKERPDGDGLRNIRSRAKEIGAEIQIESEQDMGTRCVLSLNY
ncbi:triple tyrosine motif-containing protein, partial [Balneolaceae bacterium ANBcel3]|nr:triple tyrosine motif-containing protein [Balneolaceae bacterium ANBcel3]